MNKQRKLLISFLIAVTVILFLGYHLRLRYFAEVPFPGESRDEYSFAWVGLSLIMSGRPVATSGLAPYTHDYRYINVDRVLSRFNNPNPFPIDQPWFDHPPLFGLIPGGYSYLRGARIFADTAVHIIRRPMIWIGVLNIGLLIWFATLVFGRRPALLAGLLYATEPLAVISSRTVQAENFLITGLLLALISYYCYLKTKRGFLFWLTVSLCGLFTLVKLSAISIALTIILLIFIFDVQRPFLKSLWVSLGTFTVLLFFPLLGLMYDIRIFAGVLADNSGRFLRDGVNILNQLFFRQNITRDFSSGFVPLGLIAGASLVSVETEKKNYAWVAVPLLVYLLVYIVFGSEGYGWYKYPLFPWLFLAIAVVVDRMIDRFNSLFALFLLSIPGGIMLNRFLDAEKLRSYIWPFRLMVLLVFLLVLLPLTFSRHKNYRLLNAVILLGIIISLLILNIFTNYAVTPESWFNFNFLKSI